MWFPTFSSCQQTTSPARPSRWAGHEALVLEAAGQVCQPKNHVTFITIQRKGVWGKETLSPAGSRGTAPGALSPISPEKWGPGWEASVPAVPTAQEKDDNAPRQAPAWKNRNLPMIKQPSPCQANHRTPRQEEMAMTSKELWALFLQTGLPEIYCLARRRARQEAKQAAERGRDHAPDHPGNRPAGDQL